MIYTSVKSQNTKRWTADLQGYENAWSNIGNNSFMLGGNSQETLPPGVYKIDVANSGALIYCSISIIYRL